MMPLCLTVQSIFLQFRELAPGHVAVCAENNVSSRSKSAQMPQKRFSHDILRIIAGKQKKSSHRYIFIISSLKLPGTGEIARADLNSVFWKALLEHISAKDAASKGFDP